MAKKSQNTRAGNDANHGITKEEVKDVEERSSPRVPVIYAIVRRLGEDEMARPVMSLWWSGIAAGISISFSVLAQAILQAHLPAAPWQGLVSGFGYSVGFLMVVLGRQQLFTEITLTAVLPVLADLKLANLLRMARLWGIVLAANLTGTMFAALFCSYTPVVQPEHFQQMLVLSAELKEFTWLTGFLKGLGAGFIIATMVWLIPSSEGAQFFVITILTYLIAIAGFSHVVAGSMEAFLLVINGQWGILPMLGDFIVPVVLGNIVGGTALFALIAYAQVMHEI
jgi:formate/nitrite transporter FocA (FNT family)